MGEHAGIVVSVGAGPLQYEFIERLKVRGYTVAAFGKGRNSSRAIELCDYFKEIDTSDSEEAVRWLDSLGMPVIAAGSYAGGVAIKTLQSISNHYNLPTAIHEDLIVGMNKIEQQAVYEKYGLSNIPTFSGENIKDNIRLINENAEYIIKPLVGRGSSGVELMKGSEVTGRIREGKLNDNDMIQKMIRGKEYRMLMMVQYGEIKLLAPVLRTSYKQTFFLGRLQISYEDYDCIREHALKIIGNLGIRNSILKYDIIVSDDEVNLIEMDIGVGGGTYFKKFISMAAETDLMDMYIQLICGGEIQKADCLRNNLVMDYVYNENVYPVSYDIESVKKTLEQKLGEVELIQNQLHPEKKGFYHSNADFLFTVIHKSSEMELVQLNKFINQYLLHEDMGE